MTFIVNLLVLSLAVFIVSLIRIHKLGKAGVPLWEVVVMVGAQMVILIVALSYLYAVGMAA